MFSEDAFAGLPPEGTTVTFDRARALEREEITFLTWDHPMVLGALELLLGGESGNCASSTPRAMPAAAAASSWRLCMC